MRARAMCARAARRALALGAAAGVVAGGQEGSQAKPASCWDGDYTFESCCRTIASEVPDARHVVSATGNASCWQGQFSYAACCRPDREARFREGLRLIDSGEFRNASHQLFQLWALYTSGNEDAVGTIFSGFEKAAMAWKKELNALPDSLTHFQVLFHGQGIECAHVPGEAPHENYARCCMGPKWQKSEAACLLFYDMMMRALGRAQPDKEAYYSDFSEQWAYRHFTPSVLTEDTGSFAGEADEALKNASRLDRGIAEALTADGDSLLGIVWAEHYPGFRSTKFRFHSYFLTLALHHIRADPASLAGERPLHVIEVGGGYGNVPRLLGRAQRRLAALQPPVRLGGYVCFDLRSVSDLQHWYLNKTLGSGVTLRDWTGPEDEAWSRVGDGRAVPSWPDARAVAAGEPMAVDLVDSGFRDVFVHLYERAAAQTGGAQSVTRPIRLVFACNSWHEMPLGEFMWYHNAFMAGRFSPLAADWVLYVSNPAWHADGAKENLMLKPPTADRFEVVYSVCNINCVRLLKRIA